MGHCSEQRGDFGSKIVGIGIGVLAGSFGTVALNASTYLDMALRGRPPSTVPSDTVRKVATRLGAGVLAHGGETAGHRRDGLGALLGYGIGATIGAAYGLTNPIGRARWLADGIVLSATAIILGNAGPISTGAADPRRWTANDWLEDVVPHLCFGMATSTSMRIATRPSRT